MIAEQNAEYEAALRADREREAQRERERQAAEAEQRQREEAEAAARYGGWVSRIHQVVSHYCKLIGVMPGALHSLKAVH